MTSCNGQRKVRPQKVRKQVKNPMRYGGMMCKTSRTNCIKSGRNYIKISAKKASSVKNIRPSKLVVTIAQINDIYDNKILEN